MKHLLRKHFDARDWDAADLDAAADFWLSLFDQSHATGGLDAAHRTEVRLRGFPRPDGQAVRDEVARRLGPLGFAHDRVTLADPDTLSAATGFTALRDPPPGGLGVPALAGPSLDGLYAEVRLTAVGFRDTAAHPRVESTLVLVGELQGGRLILKALWRAGGFGWDDRTYRNVPWPNEKVFLKELDRGRASGWVETAGTRALAAACFPTRWADRQTAFWVNLQHVPRDKRPRLGRLLARVGILAGVAALLGLVFLGPLTPQDHIALFLGVMIVVLASVPVFRILWKEAQTVARARRSFHQRFGRLYAQTIRFLPVPEDEVEAVCGNPFTRKYHAELLRLGCRHVGDIRADREGAGRSVIRCYYAPDGVTAVSLIVMVTITNADGGHGHETWPSSNNLLLRTQFAGGGRLATSTEGTGFRRKLSPPELRGRYQIGLLDPAELLARHAADVKRYEEDFGRVPEPLSSFEEFVLRCEEDHREQADRYRHNPCTWADAFNFAMCRVRRAYRG